ncbi:MAG: hypothetical protein QNJ44_18180 [Rhodobacter sp.]|nr:hypothetical protein [Rhodobacter sp.]
MYDKALDEVSCDESNLTDYLESRLDRLDMSMLSALSSNAGQKLSASFWDWHDKSGDDDWTKVSWEKVG